jgi:hypothetical protein
LVMPCTLTDINYYSAMVTLIVKFSGNEGKVDVLSPARRLENWRDFAL